MMIRNIHIYATGLLAGFNLRFELPIAQSSFLQFSSTYNSINANGAQTQEWYGDDPSSPQDDTGEIFSGIPHTVRSKQYTLTAQLGIEF